MSIFVSKVIPNLMSSKKIILIDTCYQNLKLIIPQIFYKDLAVFYLKNLIKNPLFF